MFKFDPFLLKNVKRRFFPKVSFKSTLRRYVSATSCKNEKNPSSWYFMKLGKPNFGPNLASFSQKNCTRTLPKSDDILTSCKNSKKTYNWLQRKTSKQANGKKRTKICRVFHRSLILWVPKITLPKGDKFPNSAKVSNRFILNISLYIYDKAFCKYN